jgi:hypothetical protein
MTKIGQQMQKTSTELRFDQYSIKLMGTHWTTYQMFRDVPMLVAEALVGVEPELFHQSLEYNGWCGTCPEWAGFKPVVTVQSGDKLDFDHITFLLEQIG